MSRNRQHVDGALLQLNYSAMRVQLHCTLTADRGLACPNAGCTGEMATRVLYGSDLSEEVFSGWFFPHGSNSLAADEVKLTHAAPGGTETLFEKAAVVARVPLTVNDLRDGIEAFVSVELGSAPPSVANDDCYWLP